MMATQSSLQDCYFYFYSSCTKGDECPFRHCELALGTETVCSLWREGRCFRSNCKFRHMESRINRSSIPCYWENQPGGCRKPHCVFLHRRLRNGIQVVKDTPGLILPTSDGKISPKHPDSSEISSLPNKAALVEKAAESDVPPDPSLEPVPPLVLSFDEGEESDTESVSSTPVKQADKKAASTRSDLSARESGAAEEKDFGIKTLEQIRMEKIHKESDGYYGAVSSYASAPIDSPRLIEQHYPPKAEFLALPKDSLLDKSIPTPIVEPKLSGVDEETDLRGRLLNRRNAPSIKVNQAKRLINFKNQNGNQVEVAASKKLDFKIKTLEEIRRERESKQSKSEAALDNSPSVLPSAEEKKPPNNSKEKTCKKLKINRKAREPYSVPAGLKQVDVAALNLTETAANHNMISNGLKKEFAKSSDESSEGSLLNMNSSPGKRKSDDDSCHTASKAIKLVVSSNGDLELVNRVGVHSDDKRQVQPCPEIRLSAASEVTDVSSQAHTSKSPGLEQDDIMESREDLEMNGVITSTPNSSSNHKSDETSRHESNEARDRTLNSPVLPTPAKSDPISNNSVKKANSVDRSMSVDAELDEFLGDDVMNMEEMDSTPNDDILLQIEEFLES